MQVEIVSGFLGAGKTTFLNQYLKALTGRTVVIENEFGSVGLDGTLIEQDVPVRELSSGCICCTLASDFREEIKTIKEQYQPDRILIEPSGIGHLSDIISACKKAKELDGVDLDITNRIVIVDIAAFEEYADAFGSFYEDQIAHATLLLLSCIEQISQEDKERNIRKIRKLNPHAVLYENDWRLLDSSELRDLMQISADYNNKDTTVVPAKDAYTTGRIFSSITIENISHMTDEDLNRILCKLRSVEFGQLLRAKGIIPAKPQGFFHFDQTLSGQSYRMMEDCNIPTGRVILIGCNLNKPVLRALFQKKTRNYTNKPHRC